jgi:hypothetical protein
MLAAEATTMQVKSEWIFDCEPEHIWPHFLRATIDNHRPLLFWTGIPYRMVNSSMPLSYWIASLEDRVTFTPLGDGRTLVGRLTRFFRHGSHGLHQGHRYLDFPS